MSMAKQILIDCDPGLDDGVALFAAFGTDELNVLAVTTVAGNVPGPLTADNARTIVSLTERGNHIPICAGAPRPILRDLVTAEDFHGSTGLGGIEFPQPVLPLSTTHSANQIIETCVATNNPLTLVITGPMTNVALALIMSPEIADSIDEIVLMGGADSEGGNITPFAEFNVFADPHAAQIVFQSGLPIRVLNLDVTHTIRTTKSRLASVREIGNAQALAVCALLDASCQLEFSAKNQRDAPLHDPSTIIALTAPHLFEGRKAHVSVVTMPGDAFGQTKVRYAEDGPVLWYQAANSDGVFKELCRLLGGYS